MFHGPVTYASTMFGVVDWNLFDCIGIDHYRNSKSERSYAERIGPVLLSAARAESIGEDRTADVLPARPASFLRFAISGLSGIVVIRPGGAIDRHPDLLVLPALTVHLATA